ncbi:MAG TPA: WecB/TagA/CpsF family glycosyltransferase, partial [Candidatus Polarisedimenticolia bacterium]|nr:WecB/TagA/CpsF family glycosyltransferase [Candidatus Polarisedimenticolia bacterium]
MAEWGGSLTQVVESEPRVQRDVTISVCSLEMTHLAFQSAVARVLEWARIPGASFVVCMANVHMLVEAHDHPDLARELRDADMVLPDGMPLVWLMRRRGAPDQDRVAGMDFLPALCAAAERE